MAGKYCERSLASLYPRVYLLVNRNIQRNGQRFHYSTEKPSRKIKIEEKGKKQQQKGCRWNPLDIQMLSSNLHNQIFKGGKVATGSEDVERRIEKSKKHLERHKLRGKKVKAIPDVDLKMPRLFGKNIDDHFQVLARAQSEDHRVLAKHLADNSLPPVPTQWSYSKGWTAYHSDGSMKAVHFPPDQALVFDIECCVKEGNYPTLAVAASPSTWYSWCSDRLIEGRLAVTQRINLNDLIPLESPFSKKPRKKDLLPRLVVGHSVSFDRSFVKEQYYIQSTKLRFLDTLSLHMCVSGLTTYQRTLWNGAGNGINAAKKKRERPNGRDETTTWQNESSPNNLVDVHKCHVPDGEELDKSKRDTFVTGTMDDVRDDFQQLMSYCAQDVSATHEVFCVLLEKYFDRFPHPVTFAAMLEMGQCYLPLNQNWERYLQDSQESYDNLQDEMKILLMQIANENCLYLHDDLYKDDPWLWDLDWSVEKFRLRKKYYETLNDFPVIEKSKMDVKTTTEDGAGEEELAADLDEEELEEERILEEVRAKLEKTLEFLPKVNQHMAGYPAWYRDLCPRQSLPEFRNSPSLISSQTRVTPKLLRMTWEGYPLHFIAKHGWGFLVPKDGDWVNKEHYNDTSNLDDDENNLDTEGTDEASKDQKQFPVRSLRALLAAREKQQRNKMSSEINEDNPEFDGGTKRMKKKRSNPRSPLYNGRKPCIDVVVSGCWFYKLPHKDGGNANVGNPLAKDFLTKIEDGTLSSEGGLEADKILEINKVISSWRNSSKRILSQMVVHFNKSDLPPKVTRDRSYDDEGMYGAILPRVITAGTVTRRAVEPTWLTATNALPDRVGSELKAMVQAPPGYHFVGADVDSQELWIAAILGDSNFVGIHGCTALGWMTLQGNKKDATDMHSVTANTVGISRNHAKVINYARIYGAGKKFARHLLMQFNDSLSSNEAWEKAEGIFATTKGEIKYHLLPEGRKLCSLPEVQTLLSDREDEEWVSGEELNKISSWLSQKLQKDDSLDGTNLPTEVMMASKDSKFTNILKSLTDKQAWFNGSESHMFNQLEAIANSPEPRTPVLGCRISRALEPQAVNNEFLTSRVNWVVQSSAVDYLHLLLVSTKWLFDRYKIDGRFSISIHDEVRYLVKSEDRYKAALALQIANLLTRCMFAYKLGMNDLPQSIAFFSAMDIDKVLRKEVEMDCVTPSNPHGLERGYNIPKGEALNIHELLERINRGEGATVSKENAQPKVGVK